MHLMTVPPSSRRVSWMRSSGCGAMIVMPEGCGVGR
jgi:hypothetical protein